MQIGKVQKLCWFYIIYWESAATNENGRKDNKNRMKEQRKQNEI